MAGETLGIIGESGAGKTMTALSILRLLPSPGQIAAGRVRWRGRDLASMSTAELRAVRGGEIGMIFQDPVAALHPMLRIDAQVAEAVLAHSPATPRAVALRQATDLLEHLGVPGERIRHAPYPHQWSGGMCQRAMLAMAIANRPALLIADEPTTALDADTQAEVLGLLRQLQREFPLAILLITHDMAVVSAMADRVAVMREGRIVETGPVRELLAHSTHAYTARLIARTRPNEPRPPRRAVGSTVLFASKVSVTYRLPGSREVVRAVDEATFSVAQGETVGLVGASGAGKSSLARALLRLTPAARGLIRLHDVEFTALRGAALKRARADLQIVFQHPYASLNPRRTIGQSLAEPLRVHGRYGGDGRSHVARALENVRLPAEYAGRFPRELSGGERQRVAIARALILSPRVVVLDEPVSSLDAPTRQEILDLLRSLQEESGVAYLFISHDLDLIQRIADRVLVMSAGRLAERVEQCHADDDSLGS